MPGLRDFPSQFRKSERAGAFKPFLLPRLVGLKRYGDERVAAFLRGRVWIRESQRPPTNDLYLAEPSVAAGGRFCDQRKFDKPFLHQFKMAGNFPLPYGVAVGVVWQSLPGQERAITYTVPANLFPGGRTKSETIILNKPGSLYTPPWYQLDINFRKDLRVGRHVLTGEFGLFNALNAARIWWAISSAVGSSLGVVNETFNGRTPRIAFHYKF